MPAGPPNSLAEASLPASTGLPESVSGATESTFHGHRRRMPSSLNTSTGKHIVKLLKYSTAPKTPATAGQKNWGLQKTIIFIIAKNFFKKYLFFPHGIYWIFIKLPQIRHSYALLYKPYKRKSFLYKLHNIFPSLISRS